MRSAFRGAASRAPQPRPTDRSGRRARKKAPDRRATVRYSEDEYAQLKREAGRSSISEHIRWCTLLKEGRRNRSVPLQDQEALGRALGLLGQSRLAESLAAIADEAQTGSLLLDDETLLMIKGACAQVSAIRHDLLIALGVREGYQR
ncbi:MAG: hypothetical protein ROR55_03115 [Devosia sp.]